MTTIEVSCPRCGRPVEVEFSSDGQEPVDLYQYECDCPLTMDEDSAVMHTAVDLMRARG